MRWHWKDEDIVQGAILGHLEILEIFRSGHGFSVLLRCCCGKELTLRRSEFQRRDKTSCGCQPIRTRHGGVAAKYRSEYEAWRDMIYRCTKPKHPEYKRYGGRGIRVCERWLSSFILFVEDMGPKTDSYLELERVNNDGDYTPDNCKWATEKEQDRNKRTTRFIEYKGRKQCMTDWATEFEIGPNTLRWRLEQWGEQLAMEVSERYYLNKTKSDHQDLIGL